MIAEPHKFDGVDMAPAPWLCRLCGHSWLWHIERFPELNPA